MFTNVGVNDRRVGESVIDLPRECSLMPMMQTRPYRGVGSSAYTPSDFASTMVRRFE